jgi:hypothetical protein
MSMVIWSRELVSGWRCSIFEVAAGPADAVVDAFETVAGSAALGSLCTLFALVCNSKLRDAARLLATGKSSLQQEQALVAGTRGVLAGVSSTLGHASWEPAGGSKPCILESASSNRSLCRSASCRFNTMTAKNRPIGAINASAAKQTKLKGTFMLATFQSSRRCRVTSTQHQPPASDYIWCCKNAFNNRHTSATNQFAYLPIQAYTAFDSTLTLLR